MPIYEFACSQCDYKFEDLVSANFDLHEIHCPKCGANSPRKLMSAFGFSSDGKTVSSSGNSDCTGCTATSCKTCH